MELSFYLMNFKPFHSLIAFWVAFSTAGFGQENRGDAKHVIYLNMVGGMSQFETFDPKPDLDGLSGPYEAIESSIPDCRISSLLPKTAKVLDRCVVFRNVESGFTHVTEDAQHFRLTGYQRRTTISHPGIGAWLSMQVPNAGPYFRISGSLYTGSGFFPNHICEPIVIPNPNMAAKFKGAPERWTARSRMLSLLNSEALEPREKSSTAARFFSTELATDAMAWEDEPVELQADYGDHDFGKGCLLARRLVEKADALFVEVALPGWDKESTVFMEETRKLCGQLDDGFSSLILDLEKRNLLDSTLVVIATDVGRWKIKDTQRQFSLRHSCAVMAGGGLSKGKVIGNTSDKAIALEEGRVSAKTFNGIIAAAMGVDPFKTAFSPNGRPFTIANQREAGKGLPEVFKKLE